MGQGVKRSIGAGNSHDCHHTVFFLSEFWLCGLAWVRPDLDTDSSRSLIGRPKKKVMFKNEDAYLHTLLDCDGVSLALLEEDQHGS